MEPRALYYNAQQATELPNTLEELLTETTQGNRIAFVPYFEEAYWVIQTFGDGLFDADGRFTLAESGFEAWLDWLNHAQSDPGVILNDDAVSLLQLYVSEEIAYYVASPDQEKKILGSMDEYPCFRPGLPASGRRHLTTRFTTRGHSLIPPTSSSRLTKRTVHKRWCRIQV
ncbi:MAG: hypothetical protein ACK2U1_00455 [Anaerolineales bacterium]